MAVFENSIAIETDSDFGFEQAVSLLSSHVKNKRNYSHSHYRLSSQETITGSFRNQNRRREYFLNCLFDKADLTGTGYSGTVFKNCTFLDCNLELSNLNACKFENCTFENKWVKCNLTTNFSASSFWNCKFANFNFRGCHLENTQFYDTSFENCSLRSTMLENASLRNCHLYNTRFRSMNLEFSHLFELKSCKVRFPFPSVPFIFNGLKYLAETSDDITITSQASSQGYLTKDQYLELLPALETYYYHSLSFFPLTNIYIAKGDGAKARAAAIEGIKQSLIARNFRMVQYHCMQINENDLIGSKEATDLYFAILDQVHSSNLSYSDHCVFESYRSSIESTLLAGNGFLVTIAALLLHRSTLHCYSAPWQTATP